MSNSASAATQAAQSHKPDTPVEKSSEDLDSDVRFTKDFGIIPIPRRLRHDPEKPFHFGVVLNLSFGFASTFSESTHELQGSPDTEITNIVAAANLYYCQPLLSTYTYSWTLSNDQVKFFQLNFRSRSMYRSVRCRGDWGF